MWLVNFRPDILYLENATGMTPMDVAETRYLRRLIDHPPPAEPNVDGNAINIRNRSNDDFDATPKDDPDSVAQRSVDEFLDLSPADQKRSREWRMYHLLLKLAVRYPGRRKLVSILDANEVAKRLADQQQEKNAEARRQERFGLHATGARYRDRYHASSLNERGEGNDEISRWFDQANGKRKYDYELFEAEVKRQKVEGGGSD